MVYHYAMEPHSVIAHWNDEGVTVWSSAQHPFQVRNDIARLFHIPPVSSSDGDFLFGWWLRQQVVHEV